MYFLSRDPAHLAEATVQQMNAVCSVRPCDDVDLDRGLNSDGQVLSVADGSGKIIESHTYDAAGGDMTAVEGNVPLVAVIHAVRQRAARSVYWFSVKMTA